MPMHRNTRTAAWQGPAAFEASAQVLHNACLTTLLCKSVERVASATVTRTCHTCMYLDNHPVMNIFKPAMGRPSSIPNDAVCGIAIFVNLDRLLLCRMLCVSILSSRMIVCLSAAFCEELLRTNKAAPREEEQGLKVPWTHLHRCRKLLEQTRAELASGIHLTEKLTGLFKGTH